MKYYLILLIAVGFLVNSCRNFVTRKETDVYTITVLDTTNLYEQKNAPGNRDNGVIFPSSRTITSKREIIQLDSTVTRTYPDFIRLAMFESVGIIGGHSDSSFGAGMFGLFPDFSKLDKDYRGESAFFSGGIYRLLTGEWRLRWFEDAKNWTLGSSLWEEFVPDAPFERHFGSIMPLYVRKRWFLFDEIPYMTLTWALGIGYFPSQYFNTSLSLDVGSIGGFNMRVYGGFAIGYNGKGNYFVRQSPNPNISQTIILPYLGVGVSFLDFHNKVDETYIEWKDHPHSAWDVGLIQFGLLYTTADTALGSDGTSTSVIKGMMGRLLNTSIALPFGNNRFFAGVSLANLMVMGENSWGLAVMPLRLGYWMPLAGKELSTVPFVEFGFYPTQYFHIGNRLNLRFTDMLNLSFVLGYVKGSTPSGIFGSDAIDWFGRPGDISQIYVGFSVGLFDRIFRSNELRY